MRRFFPNLPHRSYRLNAIVTIGVADRELLPYYGYAGRKCGRAVRDRTVLALLSFPLATLASSQQVALMARTPEGWRIWDSLTPS